MDYFPLSNSSCTNLFVMNFYTVPSTCSWFFILFSRICFDWVGLRLSRPAQSNLPSEPRKTFNHLKYSQLGRQQRLFRTHGRVLDRTNFPTSHWVLFTFLQMDGGAPVMLTLAKLCNGERFLRNSTNINKSEISIRIQQRRPSIFVTTTSPR